MASLELSNNSKTKFSPNQLNTFGLTFGLLEDGGTCPGATKGPGGCLEVRIDHTRCTCYMRKIVDIYKAVQARLDRNTALVANMTEDELVPILQETVDEFKKKSPQEHWFFRLHYSGDFFHINYVKAWTRVISRNPEVRFWVYTRTFSAVKHLITCSNLTVMLSLDPVNCKKGLIVYNKFKHYANLGISWLGENQPKTFKWVTCPETSGALKNARQGACARCRLCIDRLHNGHLRNVRFLIH